MFFVLSKTLSLLIFPLPLVFLALLGIFLFYHHNWARTALLGVLLCFYGLSTPYVANRLMQWVEVARVSPADLQSHYDVIIVLSGMTDLQLSQAHRLEFTSSVDRILAGISLIKQGVGDILLISGGSGSLFDQTRKEATLLKDFAIQQGLAANQILTDTASRNTYENAVQSARLLHEHRYQRALLITSASHMYRAVAAFYKQGVRPDIYPVDFRGHDTTAPFDFIPTEWSLCQLRDAVYELVGLLMYRLQGYI